MERAKWLCMLVIYYCILQSLWLCCMKATMIYRGFNTQHCSHFSLYLFNSLHWVDFVLFVLIFLHWRIFRLYHKCLNMLNKTFLKYKNIFVFQKWTSVVQHWGSKSLSNRRCVSSSSLLESCNIYIKTVSNSLWIIR